ncbi:MAG: phosphoenolpyruvate carboxykinase [Thermoguttaceae bacterium]|nr:phosphoenolpyruvate carboxykinase [Thermoguttaceae bacterium]
MFEAFRQTAQRIFDSAKSQNRLIYNPDREILRQLAKEEPGVIETKYGSLAAESEPQSRAVKFTKNNIDNTFGDAELKLLEQTEVLLAKEQLVAIDCIVGDGSENVTARLIVPKSFAHIAYAGLKLFRSAEVENPTYTVIFFTDDAFEANISKKLPDKDITIRLAYGEDGQMVKIVRNSNYFGEWKKGIFAGEDWRAKQNGDAIFLHAGCRRDVLETAHGGYKETVSLFVALSANGKTSTTCRVLARKGREQSWLIQDDGGILYRDGRFRGFEAGGLFVKTDALNPGDQIEAYYGCLQRDTFFLDIAVTEDGDVDFYDAQRTSNGRAIIERRDFMHCGRDINTDRVDNIFIITRGSTIPALAKLTQEQAAAFMVLGQSMESSAGDPTQAGKIKNVFFYDPFIAGDKSEHANLFYDLLRANPNIQCYLLNTGWVGEEGSKTFHDIRLNDTMGILDSAIRGGLDDWEYSPRTKLTIPSAVRSVDSILFHPEKLFRTEEFDALQAKLDLQRVAFLAQFPNLNPKIRAAFENN